MLNKIADLFIFCYNSKFYCSLRDSKENILRYLCSENNVWNSAQYLDKFKQRINISMSSKICIAEVLFKQCIFES